MRQPRTAELRRHLSSRRPRREKRRSLQRCAACEQCTVQQSCSDGTSACPGPALRRCSAPLGSAVEQTALDAQPLQGAAPAGAGNPELAAAPAGEAAEPAAAAGTEPVAAAADAQPKLTEAEKARLRALRFGLPLAEDKEGGKGGKAAAKGEAAPAIGGLGQVRSAPRRSQHPRQAWLCSLRWSARPATERQAVPDFRFLVFEKTWKQGSVWAVPVVVAIGQMAIPKWQFPITMELASCRLT